MKLTQSESAEREKALVRNLQGLPFAAQMAAVQADRIERWRPIVAAMVVPEQLKAWVGQMEAAFGPLLLVHGAKLNWVTALLVARYGEAEYHWPTSFNDDDVLRAWRWLGGDTPDGVTYITVEG